MLLSPGVDETFNELMDEIDLAEVRKMTVCKQVVSVGKRGVTELGLSEGWEYWLLMDG